jgi:ribosomal protein S17
MDKKSSKIVKVSPNNLEKKPLEGVVLSVFKDGKTAKVQVGYTLIHDRYKKVLRRHTNYLVHLEKKVELGETVKMFPCRRLSKKKSWVVQG